MPEFFSDGAPLIPMWFGWKTEPALRYFNKDYEVLALYKLAVGATGIECGERHIITPHGPQTFRDFLGFINNPSNCVDTLKGCCLREYMFKYCI